MRFALLTTVVAIGALACGKKGSDQNQSQMQSAPPAAPGAAATSTGPVVEVKMTAGGAAALNAGMKNTVDNLAGPFLSDPNATYDVSFANAPKGTYKGYCTPHLALGMKIAIKVE